MRIDTDIITETVSALSDFLSDQAILIGKALLACEEHRHSSLEDQAEGFQKSKEFPGA